MGIIEFFILMADHRMLAGQHRITTPNGAAWRIHPLPRQKN
jgi:hypothetical protein|tara:strand:- start:15902 stop:16024 length:123 start_codon:yes stop_codon:yes gene_type:complete